jgi:two-component system response regulator FixJ
MDSAVHAASTPPIVAVVDDDLAVRSSLAFAMGNEGLSIRPYESAEALLSDPRAGEANCFVIDYKLPGQNGLELIDELRRRGVAAPAVLITTEPHARVRRAAAAGCIAIVEKPLLGDALFQEVHAALAGTLRFERDHAAPLLNPNRTHDPAS